ncbi:hypothetical protein QUB56_22035 [Microcoleus sp. AR_TQ3_B6]|uniref:hypothetical protein n=1 Tax=Microcoleus sp. AR_TQ3_B6 TaxID=3055284 RepID=UPI002FD6350F
MADSVSLLAVFLGWDLGGCPTTNEGGRTGKDLVWKSAEYVGFVGGELDWGRSIFCLTQASLSVQSSDCLVFAVKESRTPLDKPYESAIARET